MELYRRMSPARKWALVEDAIQTSRELVLVGLRLRHPNSGEEELRRRFFGIWLGEELATEVYGPFDANVPFHGGA
jgi:hypothetical protein